MQQRMRPSLPSPTGQRAFTIAEDDGAVSVDKARKLLGFDPNFRLA
jgi:hypothetical protein